MSNICSTIVGCMVLCRRIIYFRGTGVEHPKTFVQLVASTLRLLSDLQPATGTGSPGGVGRDVRLWTPSLSIFLDSGVTRGERWDFSSDRFPCSLP